MAGSSGTHTVCVCVHHQNPKLKLKAVDKNLKIEDVISCMVCSVESRECMFDTCRACPGKESARTLFADVLDTDLDSEADDIEYFQWVTTDRSTLKIMKEQKDDFIDGLLTDVVQLKRHHYVSAT